MTASTTSCERIELAARAFGAAPIADQYATRDRLAPDEVAALGSVWSAVTGDVVDVGVGGGRTTEFLLPVARSYRALDLMPAMVAACRRRFPEATVCVDDARRMDTIDAASVDLVYYSYNGIDYMPYADRAQVYAQALRVLRPGGVLVYSSHNLAALGGTVPGIAPFSPGSGPNPVRLAVNAWREWRRLGRARANRARLEAQQYFAADHAVVNDEANDHAWLTVYVDADAERRRLAEAGFEPAVRLVRRSGRSDVAAGSDAWVHYVARKPGGPDDRTGR